MSLEITNAIVEAIPRFEGYVYPNESGTHPLWGFLIVLYPYITGLVAGAFIMASLVRVFRVKPSQRDAPVVGSSMSRRWHAVYRCESAAVRRCSTCRPNSIRSSRAQR